MRRLVRAALALALPAFLAAPVGAEYYFVWSGTAATDCTASGGGALGTCFENAYPTMCGKDWGTIVGAGDTVFVHEGHTESTAANCNITGSNTFPVVILCDTGTTTGETPQGACSTGTRWNIGGATESADTLALIEKMIIHGMDAGFENIQVTSSSLNEEFIRCVDCVFEINGNNDDLVLGNNSNGGRSRVIEIIGGEWKLDSTTSIAYSPNGNTELYVSGVTVSGVATEFWGGHGVTHNRGAAHSYLTGMDFTGLASTATLVPLDTMRMGKLTIENSIIGASQTLVSDSMDHWAEVTFRNVGSGTSETNPPLQYAHYTQVGNDEIDTSITRTGGTTDGTTAYSLLMRTDESTESLDAVPLRVWHWTEPFAFPITGSATSQTWRFFYADGAQRQDDEIWVGCDILDANQDFQGVRVSSRPSEYDTPSNLSADTDNAWGNATGATVEMYIDLSFTSRLDGYASCRHYLSENALTVYTDISPEKQ